MNIYIHKDQDFYPKCIFGNGSCSNIYKNYPEIRKINYYKEFYLIQTGIHLYSLIYQIICKINDKKYFEYVLHHGLAFILIIFSYSINIMEIGSLVLLVHDFSDIFIVFSRAYSDFKNMNKKLIKAAYFITLSCWIYFRLIIFPFCLIWQTIIFTFTEKKQNLGYLFQIISK